MVLLFDQIPICTGRDPKEPERTDAPFYFSKSSRDKIQESQPASKYNDGQLVEAAVKDPVVIFHNLKRKGFEKAFGLSSLPAHRYDDNGTEVPRRPGRVFLVYAISVTYGYAVIDWEWRAGNEVTCIPNGVLSFGDVLWTRQKP